MQQQSKLASHPPGCIWQLPPISGKGVGGISCLGCLPIVGAFLIESSCLLLCKGSRLIGSPRSSAARKGWSWNGSLISCGCPCGGSLFLQLPHMAMTSPFKATSPWSQPTAAVLSASAGTAAPVPAGLCDSLLGLGELSGSQPLCLPSSGRPPYSATY